LEPIFSKLLDKIPNKEECKACGGWVVAIDGLYFFSSEKVSCKWFLVKEKYNKVRYYHAMLAPVLVHPEQKWYGLWCLSSYVTKMVRANKIARWTALNDGAKRIFNG
jgi:hypothetical protein